MLVRSEFRGWPVFVCDGFVRRRYSEFVRRNDRAEFVRVFVEVFRGVWVSAWELEVDF